jgi:hypothetical protein
LLHKEPDATVDDTKDLHVGAVVGETNGMPNLSTDNESIALPIVPVKVRTLNGELIVTHAFLDPGSNMTFCSQSLKEQLGIDGRKSTCFLSTLNERNRLVEDDIRLQICDINEELTDFMELRSVLCRPALPVSQEDISTKNDVDRWPYLKGLPVPYLNVSVRLLIGNDNASIIEHIDVIRSQHGGPCAVKTILGWSINGPLGRHTRTNNYTVNFIKGDAKLSKQFSDFCNHEFNDSLADVSTKMSHNDAKAFKIMEDTAHLTNDSHYEMELPLKNVPTCLPDNKMLANHRMNLLKKQLEKNEDLYKKYSGFITDLFDKGFAEEIPIYSANRSDGMVWYLPHHNVIHPMKPEKVRIVFDCSASYRGVSLNDSLLQGPDFTNMLTGVLMRVRMEPVALMTDVEGSTRCKLWKTNVIWLRFLWWRDGNLEQDPEAFRMKVHIFGATSFPSCCSYAIRKTATDNDDFDDIVRKTVKDNFYVDDCLTSVKDEGVAIHMANQLTQLLARGGFRLTKWPSNSPRVIASIPPEDRAVGLKDLDICNLGNVKIERALGVQWNISSDQFKFNVIIHEKPSTRRGILSVMSSIYDPLGFAAPILLPVKTILQDLARQGLKWDDPIPEECDSKWKKWLLELPKLEEFYIDRCVKKNMDNILSSELHHFCDASADGYGAVVYLRLIDSSNKIHCAFIIGKSRVTPLKVISIPRLELSAATLSVRLDNMVRRELDLHVSKSLFWTDSTSVLKFINNKDKRFLTFVANRIAIIHDGSHTSSWRYVNTGSNPADEASRGISVESLIKRPRWLTGPGFLYNIEADWPKQPECVEPIPNEHPEVKKACAVVARAPKEHNDHLDLMTQISERFSSWHKLQRCVSWILRYKHCLMYAVRQRRIGTPLVITRNGSVKQLDIDEINEAETHILRYVQGCKYVEELKCLETKTELHTNNTATRKRGIKRSSSLFKLDPIYKDGLLRVGGQIHHASNIEDNKHQIIMPNDHHVTKLLIRHYHHIAGHSGRCYVLSLLRSKYWIIHGNSAVRRVLADCIDCRRRQAKIGEQKMASLPPDRVKSNQPPFTSVGVDFFGPILVKRGRSQVKRYGCIFTCLSVRAVHIEVTQSLDTDSFLNCMRRFIARRGQPSIVRSDNGGSFTSGYNELR